MKNQNLFIVQKIMEEGFGNANLTVIDRYVNDVFTEHQFGAKNGKDGLKNTISQLHNGLSDLHFELQSSAQNGDTVWTHYKATAIQSGLFMNMPPSGRQISIDIMDIFRLEEGLLVEHWGVPDRFAAMMQLGVMSRKEKVL